MVDFSVIRPSFINYEIASLTKSEKNESMRLLVDQGYRVTMGNLDAIAYRLSA